MREREWGSEDKRERVCKRERGGRMREREGEGRCERGCVCERERGEGGLENV